jgi:DNA-binding LacI/PurR family transcriptional regulator
MKRNRPRIYNRLTDDLLSRIKKGYYKDKLPGIDFLADEFKVNRKTVNKSISKLVTDGILIRVPGRGAFIPGRMEEVKEKEVKRKNSRRYAFLVSIEDLYQGYMDLMAGLEEEISGIAGCLIYIKFDQKFPEKLLGSLRYNKIEGVIVCGLIDEKLLDMLKREFSILLVDYSSPAVPVNSIVWESYGSGLKLGESIIRKGIKELFLLNTFPVKNNTFVPRPLQYNRRIEAIISVLEKSGVKINQYKTDWNLSNIDKNHELAALLRKGSVKKAFFCDISISALIKLGCIDLCAKVLMTGVGDRRSVENYSLPGIYISHDMLEMGREAGRCIIDIIGRPSSRVKEITLIPDIVEIGSDPIS